MSVRAGTAPKARTSVAAASDAASPAHMNGGV